MEARLIDSREIAPGVRHFEFEALGVEKLEFVPGQFTSFTGVMEARKSRVRIPWHQRHREPTGLSCA